MYMNLACVTHFIKVNVSPAHHKTDDSICVATILI